MQQILQGTQLAEAQILSSMILLEVLSPEAVGLTHQKELMHPTLKFLEKLPLDSFPNIRRERQLQQDKLNSLLNWLI